MKETANRYAIALLSVMMVCLLAVPAMAGNLDELETRCWDNCLNGTITNGTVIVLCNMTGLPTIGNWTFTLPEGEVEIAYMHWHRWGACHGTDITAEFWNGTGAYESIGFDYPDEDPVVYEDHGVWFTDYSPRNGNHHYYWKVNASAGTNTFNATGCYETDGEHCDARWFIAVINNTDEGNRTHDGHWWHNTGYKKTDSSSIEQETWYYNASTNPISTAANYTLWTAQTHYGSSTPSIEFNGQEVGTVCSACDGHGDGQYADYSLCKFNVLSTRIDADGDQKGEWKYDGDAYYVNFGTLAEKISSQAQPDLVVEDIIFPEVMNSSASYTIKARIKNQGDAGTGNMFNVSLNVDTHSDKVTDVGPLGAGASTTVSFTSVNLEDGCHEFTVTADCDSNVSESNEINNATSEWYQVGNVIVVHNNSDLISEADRNVSGTYYIENRTITNCAGCGITIENTTLPFVIQNCTVHDCACKGSTGDSAGICLDNVTSGTIGDPSDTNTIENNTDAGIRVKNSTYVDITDNKIQNNTVYGIYAYPRELPVTSETCDDCNYINVTNNTITKNDEAIDLIAHNCTVKNNTIRNNTAYGIYLYGNNSDITDGNNIRNNTDYGVKLYNSYNNDIHCNTLADNNAGSPGHQAWDNGDNDWNSTDAGENYTGNRWKDWDDNSGYPCNYTIDGGSNVDKRPKGFYDFLTGAGEDKWAFKDEIGANPPDGNGVPDGEFSSSNPDEYARIEADDDTNYQSDETGATGNYAAHRFNFSISEDPDDISEINVTWNGKGYHDSNPDSTYDGAYLYIWNGTGYEELANNSGDGDWVYLTGVNATAASNYVNGGNVTVLVVQKSPQTRSKYSHIETDYVRLVVTA
ncbi:MAG: CARDB domain-containing protein [Euryarchaeota archaeon]|nr:CARDB domain-containing protein [Euryarchaeota archaeon]